jgi:hypothetical protein
MTTDTTVYIPSFEKLISLYQDTIYIQSHLLGFAFNQYHEDFLVDFFCAGYQGQPIVVIASDGENLLRRGIVNFFEELCQQGVLNRELVTFASYDLDWHANFTHKKLGWHHSFTRQGQYVEFGNIPEIDSDAKFVGCLISRFTPSRLKLAYQIDKTFPSNNFLTFRNANDMNVCGKNFYSMIDPTIDVIYQEYQDQLNWLASKTFDVDNTLVNMGLVEGFLPWTEACKAYHALWPKYHIECVTETDIFSNSFLTEKTAKCLISAKPFVVMSGPGSLKRLQDIGFTTYSSVIDESYDLETMPHNRMAAMMQSLMDLYHSPDKQTKIDQLNKIARRNQKRYDKICRKI